jgi:uncharacterized membrane protein
MVIAYRESGRLKTGQDTVMDDKDARSQALEVVGRGLARELGTSRAHTALADGPAGLFRFELVAHRSLSRAGFYVVMAIVVIVNAAVGGVFMALGAWPVLAFCGLDILLVYWAFTANYRAGRQRETIEITPAMFVLTRVHPSGSRERFEANPFWVRVRLAESRDGRNELCLISHGEELHFARFLSDDERRDFAGSLTAALMAARSARLEPGQ